jgi:hypothetical protein
VLAVLESLNLCGMINTVKAAAEMDENFAGGRFYCCCEIVDSDLRTNHATMAGERGSPLEQSQQCENPIAS